MNSHSGVRYQQYCVGSFHSSGSGSSLHIPLISGLKGRGEPKGPGVLAGQGPAHDKDTLYVSDDQLYALLFPRPPLSSLLEQETPSPSSASATGGMHCAG